MQNGQQGGEYDLIVVGGGVFGLSTAWEAGRRGRRTLLLERRSIPNPIAASYGPTRKIRSVYANPHYARLAREAMRGWREVEALVEAELYVAAGGIYYTNLEDSAELAAREAAVRAVGSPIRVVEGRQLREEFPLFRRARRAIVEQDAGFLRATACVEALAALARREGVEVVPNREVEAIEPGGGGLIVRAGDTAYRAARVVLAGGGWSGRLFPELNRVLRQYQLGLAYVHDAPPAFYHPALIPWACVDVMFYGFGAEAGVGLKLAQHVIEAQVDDPDFDRDTRPPGFAEAVERFLQDDFGLDPAAHRVSYDSCMYNMSPSSDFLLDFHPEWPGLFIATAGSGHGFKFGSIIGQIVLDRLDGVDSDRWSPSFSYDTFRSAAVAERLL